MQNLSQLRDVMLLAVLVMGIGGLCSGRTDAAPTTRIGAKVTTQGRQPPNNNFCETNLGFEREYSRAHHTLRAAPL